MMDSSTMAARARSDSRERSHAWDALEKRLLCFQHMLVSDMPKRIAVAFGAPHDAEKIAATIKAAYEKTKARIAELRADPMSHISNSDEMCNAVVNMHQDSVIREMSQTLGMNADHLLPTLDLRRALKEAAELADKTYKDAVADFHKKVAARQAMAVKTAAKAAKAAAASAAANAARATSVARAANGPAVRPTVGPDKAVAAAVAAAAKAVGSGRAAGGAPKAGGSGPGAAPGSGRYTGATPPKKAKAAPNPAPTPATGAETGTSAKPATGKSSGGGGGGNAGVTKGNSGSGGVRRQGAGGGGAAKVEKPPEEDRHGLLKLPRDHLESVSERLKAITGPEAHVVEDRRLRPIYVPPPEQVLSNAEVYESRAKQWRMQGIAMGHEQPWYAKNIVDHRSAWCGLRDAGRRAGLIRVLRPRPWGDPSNPSRGGRVATESDVLELMSNATQKYIKRVLVQLTTVAWQRRGGLSEDILKGLEARMEDPRFPPPSVELRKGLIPKLSEDGPKSDPRAFLKREEDNHRRDCLERETGWRAEVFEALTAADTERKRSMKRKSMKDEPLQEGAVDQMVFLSKSGWLSREQLAANEFARRVGVERGVGLAGAAAAEWKRKERAGVTKGGSGLTGEEGSGEDVSAVSPTSADIASSKVTEKGGGNNAVAAKEYPSPRGTPVSPMEVEGNCDIDKDDDDDQDRPKLKLKKGGEVDENEGKTVGGQKERRDESESDREARGIVRDVRRRLSLTGHHPSHYISEVSTAGNHVENGSTEAGAIPETAETRTANAKTSPRRTEINNADLAEYLRAVKPQYSRGGWTILASMRRRLASQRRRVTSTAAVARASTVNGASATGP